MQYSLGELFAAELEKIALAIVDVGALIGILEVACLVYFAAER
jgi:hypothetical protein